MNHIARGRWPQLRLLVRRANSVEVLRDPLHPAASDVPPVDGIRREVSRPSSLLEGEAPLNAVTSDGWLKLELRFLPDVSLREAREIVQRAGGRIESDPSAGLFRVFATPDALAELATNDSIWRLDFGEE